MGVGVAGCRLELLLIGIGLAKPQIFFDRTVEQIGVLVDDGDHPAHGLGVERLQIATADQDFPLLRVEQAKQQARDRGFS